jgi:hypothetical protein
VAGVTSACVSVTPPLPRPAVTCSSPPKLNVRTTRSLNVGLRCSQHVRFELVEPPAHGVADPFFAGFSYRPAPGYVGPDAFTVRGVADDGRTSPPVRINVDVVPGYVRPAAPKLTVSGVPALDRRGRVVLRGICDRACTVSARVRVRLHTGRVIDGRTVSAQAAESRTVTLALKRAKLPRHRRVVRVSIRGEITGADGRARTLDVTVKR